MVNGNRAVLKQDYATYIHLEGIVKGMNDNVEAIIVEGACDKEAMKGIGFSKEIIMYKSFSNADIVEYLRRKYKNKRVAILTDYDRNGKDFNKKLGVWLENGGVKVEKRYREKIGKLLGVRGRKCIESVNSLRKKNSFYKKAL